MRDANIPTGGRPESCQQPLQKWTPEQICQLMGGMDVYCVSLWLVLRVITMRDTNIPTGCRPGSCQHTIVPFSVNDPVT